MNIYISNLIYIKKVDITEQIENGIRDAFTRKNPIFKRGEMFQPAAIKAEMKTQKSSNNGYDKLLKQEYLRSYFDLEEYIAIPRGTGTWARTFLRKHGIEAVPVDSRSIHERIDFRMNYGAILPNNKEFNKLYDYQDEARRALVSQTYGVFRAKCGGGKTITGMSTIELHQQPTLIIVHTQDLATQWQRELVEKTIGSYTIGRYGLGQKELGEITIATTQTLCRLHTTELIDFMRNFGCVILDECHHAPAHTFDYVLNHATAYFRFGLTATPSRLDGLSYKMVEVIGPIVYSAKNLQIQGAGITSNPPKVTVKQTEYSAECYSMRRLPVVLSTLSRDHKRTGLIIECVVDDWKDGRFCLVLSKRVDQCKTIAKALTYRGMNVGLLIGQTPKYERDKLIQEARAGKVDAIIGTNVADEGLDIPTLDTLHYAMPHSNKQNMEQQIGRIERKGGMDPVVRHYRDGGYFAKVSNNFLQICRRWKYEVEYID